MCNSVNPHKLPKAMKSNVRCRHYKLSCQPAMLVILFICSNVNSYKLPKAMKCNVRCQVSMLQIVMNPARLVILFTCLPITYTDTNIVQCFQVSYIAECKPYSSLLLHNVLVQSHWFVIASDKYKVCLFFFICFAFASQSCQNIMQVIIATPLVGNTKS